MTTVVGILIYPKSDYTYVVYMLKNLTLSANLFRCSSHTFMWPLVCVEVKATPAAFTLSFPKSVCGAYNQDMTTIKKKKEKEELASEIWVMEEFFEPWKKLQIPDDFSHVQKSEKKFDTLRNPLSFVVCCTRY